MGATVDRKRGVLAALTTLIGLLACVSGCDTTGNMRPGSESVLDLFAEPSPAEAAADAVDRYDSDKRYRGTLRLGMASFASEPVYMRLFIDNMKDQDATVRTAATRAVANHGGPEHVPLLVGALKDEDTLVRLEAARGLQRIYNPVAIDPLLGAIKGPENPEDFSSEDEVAIRAEAAHALGQYKEPKVVQALIAELQDENLAVNRNTLESLRTLTGQDFGFDKRGWLEWYEGSKDVFAAGKPYVYPIYRRSKSWYEYLPFVPPPPNEEPATPAGMPIAPPGETGGTTGG
jgi:hypothetical protein